MSMAGLCSFERLFTCLNVHSLQPADCERDGELESFVQLLLFKFTHLRGRIKQVADRYLSKMVDRYVPATP